MAVRCESIILSILISALLAAVAINAQRRGECCQEYCYELDTERPQSAHFASKTPYTIAKGPESGRQYLVPSECLICFLHIFIHFFFPWHSFQLIQHTLHLRE